MTQQKKPVRSLHWDSFRSWVDPAGPCCSLFTQPHPDQAPANPLDEAVSSRLWCGFFPDGAPFRFEQYGVMLDCPRDYSVAIMRGTTATFCATSPARDVFKFPNANARWMFPDDMCEVARLRHDKAPPQGMNAVELALASSPRLPLLISPYLSFAVRLDFKQGARDALWLAQQKHARIKIVCLMWGVLGAAEEPKP